MKYNFETIRNDLIETLVKILNVYSVVEDSDLSVSWNIHRIQLV